jgi:hypothetical protein
MRRAIAKQSRVRTVRNRRRATYLKREGRALPGLRAVPRGLFAVQRRIDLGNLGRFTRLVRRGAVLHGGLTAEVEPE